MAEVIVADRLTDANQKRLEVSRLQVSWAHSEAGIIAFDIPVRDMFAAGVDPAVLLGKWLHYTHPTAGPWGGQVTNVLMTDGIASVSGESWASCLRGIVSDGVITGSSVPGTIKRLIDAAKGLTGISSGTVESGGTSQPFEGGGVFGEPGNDLYDSLLPAWLEYHASLPSNFGLQVLQPYGYNVDPASRVFSFKKKIGTDRSATVKLADGVTNTSGSWGDDLTDVINTVTLEATIEIPGKPSKKEKVCKKKKGKKKCKTVSTPGTPDRIVPATATAKNTASIAKYGPRSIRIVEDYNARTQQNLQNQAQDLANAYSRNEQLVTVKLARDPSEIGGGGPAIFAAFREGDVVSVDLANEGGVGKMAVRYRALDVGRGEMTVSGEAEIA